MTSDINEAPATEATPIRSNTAIGYAITFVMDYGNGRQVNIAGCLPLNSTKEDFDRELDKLRLATDRQKAFIVIANRQAQMAAEKKMAESLTHILTAYDAEMEKEMERLTSSPEAKQNLVKSQIVNMRAEAANYRKQKLEEIKRHEAEAAICEVIIASAQKEVGEPCPTPPPSS